MTEIAWEEPPAARGAALRDWRVIAEALKAKPGAWAIVAICPSQNVAAVTAKSVRSARYLALDGGRWDAVARTVDGEFRVYARYIGEATPP